MSWSCVLSVLCCILVYIGVCAIILWLDLFWAYPLGRNESGALTFDPLLVELQIKTNRAPIFNRSVGEEMSCRSAGDHSVSLRELRPTVSADRFAITFRCSNKTETAIYI